MSEFQESSDAASIAQPPECLDFQYSTTFTPEERKNLIRYLIEENRHYYKYSKKLSKRVSALKKIQHDYALLNCKFYIDLVRIERKYETEMNELYEKRRQIVSGEREPTDEEAQCTFPVGKYVNWHVDLQRLVDHADEPGVRFFWMFVLLGVPFIRDMCRQDDLPVLQYIEDISCELTSPPGFSVKFHFSPNPYFTNKILRRDCLFRIEPDRKRPFEFEGAEVLENKGCTINWKPGMNVTVPCEATDGVDAGGDSKRIDLQSSFFNFFDDSTSKKTSFTSSCIASYFRERIIPKAVLFFTGEAFVIDDNASPYETESTSDDGSSKINGVD